MNILRGRKKSSDAFSEKLLPTRVTISRQRGALAYIFEIEGFVGERTGEIHYKASEVSRIEKLLNEHQGISEFKASNIGLILYSETPLAVASESVPTGTLVGVDEIFRLQPQANTRVPELG